MYQNRRTKKQPVQFFVQAGNAGNGLGYCKLPKYRGTASDIASDAYINVVGSGYYNIALVVDPSKGGRRGINAVYINSIPSLYASYIISGVGRIFNSRIGITNKRVREVFNSKLTNESFRGVYTVNAPAGRGQIVGVDYSKAVNY